MYDSDPRTVITLDAGGTHFRFSAMRGCEAVTDTFELPTHPNDLPQLLEDLRTGFQHIIDQLPEKPVAISFAFPGPADYPNGVIPDRLSNFPCFEGGVALGAFLEEQFHLPVFINNDADLFTYGEALAGALPMLNERIRNAGGVKEYRNLIGFILGTGFGIGVTSHDQMYMGDNCCSEIYCSPSKWGQKLIAEDGVALRAVLRHYRELAHDPKAAEHTDSYDIYRIADGTLDGDKEAALKAFDRFGEAAGYAIIGVSRDRQELQKRFADAKNLDFPLIADTDASLLQQLGAIGEKTSFGKRTVGILRTTYLVNEEGIIEKIFTPKEIKTKIHAEQILDYINQ